MWGGFNAQGGFALRLWTPTSKMKKEEWMEHVPALKRAAAQAGASHCLSCHTCKFSNQSDLGELIGLGGLSDLSDISVLKDLSDLNVLGDLSDLALS